MAKPICCQEVGEHLARHGMPPWRIERVTDELAGHWEDLHQAALERGFSPPEAVIEANRQLGQPEDLSKAITSGLRRGSWMGRHPLLTICLVPMILPFLIISIVGVPFMVLDHWLHFTSWMIDRQPVVVDLLHGGAWVTYFVATAGSVIWLCGRAWKNGLGVRWVLALCSWFTLASILRFMEVDPIGRHLTVGVGFPARLNANVIALFAVHLVVSLCILVIAYRIRKRSSESLLLACFSESTLEPTS